jgi:DNA-binding GntR family transcriptional regulator
MTSDMEQRAGGTAPALLRRMKKATVPAASGRGTTASAMIYRALRDDIVSMRRKPGEPIIEKQIAQAQGVSRTPVREALLRLADERLIDIFPQSGTFVSRIPVAALPEAILIRKALEQATVRYAAQQAGPAQIALLRANLEVQHRTLEAEDAQEFHEADEAFHALIATVAGYPGFWTLTQQVKVQVDRFRRLTLPVPGRMKFVIDQHTAIVDAIAAHDGERAVEMMTIHLDDLRASIENTRISNPYYFYESEE